MKMSVSLSLLFPLSLLIHTAFAHDITQILNQYPEYSTFNSYLTQSNLAADINARQTITVLVVDNANISPLSSTPSPDTIKNILSVHVILDYYDASKLQLTSGSALLTTLFQSTGLAKGQQGFLTVSHPSAGTTAFASAMPGSTQASTLVKSVTSQPYNISVIQISSPIIPQGIDGAKTSSPPSTTTTPSAIPPPPPATVAPPTPMVKAPVPSVAPSKPTTAPASSPPTNAGAPTTAVTPSATPGSAPSPGGALFDAAAKGDPTVTDPAADKPKGKSAATTLEMGLGVVCTMALSSLYMTSSLV